MFIPLLDDFDRSAEVVGRRLDYKLDRGKEDVRSRVVSLLRATTFLLPLHSRVPKYLQIDGVVLADDLQGRLDHLVESGVSVLKQLGDAPASAISQYIASPSAQALRGAYHLTTSALEGESYANDLALLTLDVEKNASLLSKVIEAVEVEGLSPRRQSGIKPLPPEIG